MTITRTVAAVLATGALLAPVAQARPAEQSDMQASRAIAAAKERHKQDLRSPDARDAALRPRTVGEPAPPALSEPQTIAPAGKTRSGVDWAAIAAGAAAGLLAMAGAVALSARRTRRRVTA